MFIALLEVLLYSDPDEALEHCENQISRFASGLVWYQLNTPQKWSGWVPPYLLRVPAILDIYFAESVFATN